MTEFNPASRLGHGALKVEATAGTAVTPDTFFEFLTADITVAHEKTAVGSVATKVAKNMRFRKALINTTGNIELYVEPKTAGHFFKGFLGAPSTSTIEAGEVFLHEFTMANGNTTYTIELAEAGQDYVHRYFGVVFTKITLNQEDDLLKMMLEFTSQRAFDAARVTTAANSGTTLLMDQTSGLTSSDTIVVLDKDDRHTVIKELAITSVDSETQLTTATIDVQIDVDDVVMIKKQTASYSLSKELTWVGNSQYKLGDDIDNTATKKIQDFTFEFERPATVFHSADGFDFINRHASSIKRIGFMATGSIQRCYTTEEFIDKLRNKEKTAFRLLTKGQAIGTNAAAVQATANFGTGTGFSVTATAAGSFDGDIGNDVNVVFVINSTDDLAAAISGTTVTISLASTTASKNTGTLIASAVNALTGVDSAAISGGAEQFTTAATKVNLSGGRDALQKEMLQIDIFDANLDPFSVASEEDVIIIQDINFQGAYDSDNSALAKISLRNDISAY